MKCESIHATHAHAIIGLRKFQKPYNGNHFIHLCKDLGNFNSTSPLILQLLYKMKKFLQLVENTAKNQSIHQNPEEIAQHGEVTLNIRKTERLSQCCLLQILTN